MVGEIHSRFPSFCLEDKAVLEEEGIVTNPSQSSRAPKPNPRYMDA